ncbi:MAG TPA: hypothetical protein PK912_10415 [Microthrixaceae bacterium]|nr:hypothetical protein [Microthrixaceae bacterium]
MTDDPPPVDGSSDPVVDGPADGLHWGLDAVLGAAVLGTRAAGEVAGAMASAPPVRFLGGVARWCARPLSAHGAAVRAAVVRDGLPAARDAVRRVTPAVVDAVDLDSILAAVDVGALIDRVDVDGIVSRVDVEGIVSRVDVDRIVAQVDIGALLERVDIGALLDRIDLNALLAGVDLNALLAGVDLNALLSGVDLNALLAGVDLNDLLDGVELDALLAGVDLNALLAGVDLNTVLGNLDLNEVVGRIDMDGLIANTEMGAIIVRSTGGVASEALDVVRSQGVSIDTVIARIANRVLGRRLDDLPAGPELLVDRRLALPAGDDSAIDESGVS